MPDDRIICTVHELNTYDWECFRPSESGRSPLVYFEDKPNMQRIAELAEERGVDLGVMFDRYYGEGRFDDETRRQAMLDYYKSIGVTFDD